MLNNIYELLFDKFFSFKGRSSRREYVFRVVVISLVFSLVYYKFDIMIDQEGFFVPLCALLLLIVHLLFLFQYFPLAVRRLHDFNVSGWWILISFIPCGQLIVFWLIFKKGTEGVNDYGEPPKY